MSDFLSLCRHRRSIRKYQAQAIEPEKIDYILRCALTSPSSKRTNPWEFVVVTDGAKIRQMSGCKTYGSQMFETAQAAIVVVLDPSLTDTWQADGAIVAEQMMLAATEQDLGSCWCQVLDREGAEEMMRTMLGIPENLRVLCVISLGYRDEERRDYDIDKLLYNKIHYGQY